MIFEKREGRDIQEASMGFMIYDPDGCRGCVSFGGGGVLRVYCAPRGILRAPSLLLLYLYSQLQVTSARKNPHSKNRDIDVVSPF